MMHLGLRLKGLMKVRGVTTSAMAVHCEVSRGAVSNWFVNGRISKENLMKAAEKLRTTSDRLVKFDVDEILELEELDRKNGAKGVAQHMDGALKDSRKTYSLSALELALMFDKLPTELARNKVIGYVENLLVGSRELSSRVAPAAPPARVAAAKKRSSARPKPKPTPAAKKSRVRARG